MKSYTPTLPSNFTPIQNVDSLLRLLSITKEDLSYIFTRGVASFYTEKEINKKSGGKRLLHAPNRKIKFILRKINNKIFNNVLFPHYLFGSISDKENPRDYIRCAEVHCKAKILIKIDISNFFPSINTDSVCDVYKGFFNFSDEVSDVLTKLTTVNGAVPQGAPTSTFLSNLYFYNIEPQLVEHLESVGFRYTRLIDDITISKLDKNNFMFADERVRSMIIRKGLTINEGKSSIRSTVAAKGYKVHGVCIDEDKPRFTKSECVKITDEVYQIARVGYNKSDVRMRQSYHKAYYSVKGKITKLKRVGYTKYDTLRKILNRHCEPLPDHDEIKRLNRVISNIQRDYTGKPATDNYKRRYYQAHFRLSVLRRIYKEEAKQFRARLISVRPNR
ncbi:reverse transcriptase family protein [Yersinia proxima]|uniref:reverse transcriptase family protein n=1 Tax=Yersinia proxima TaxID=2890316 RepID=UPI003D69E54A